MKIKDLLKSKKGLNDIAIVSGDSLVTYKEWFEKSSCLSKKIKNLVDSNSIYIGMFLPNSLDYAITYFGITFSDKIIVPIEITSSKDEIFNLCKQCEIELIISNSKYIRLLQDMIEDYQYKITIYLIDCDELIKNKQKNYTLKSNYLKSNDEVAIILHTSGTTSNSKRVMLTHINLISNVKSNIENLNLTKNEITLITLPMCFGYCNTTQFLTYAYLGAKIVILDGIFTPKKFFSIIEKEKITNTTVVPTTLLMLLNYRYHDSYNLDSLKFICFGGGKISNEMLLKIYNMFPNVGFIQTYGQTECSPRLTSLLPEDSIKKIGSVGTEIPSVTINIVNDNNKLLPSNETGEIIVKGPNVMKGYFKNDEATNDIITDGWIHTGDLGYKDNDGYLYLVGRKKNIIISGGINIYPEEIEEVLISQYGIKDAFVYGKSDKWLGEVPVADIVVTKTFNMKQLKIALTKKLPKHKVPKQINIVNNISKTNTGKNKRY